TAAAHDLDTFCAQTKSGLHSTLHRTAESHAANELVSNTLRNKLRIDFRLADFNDVQLHFAAGHRCKLRTKLFDVRALLADDHTRTGSINRHAAQLSRTLDHHLRNCRLRQVLHDVLADLNVFLEQLSVVTAFGVPAAIPSAVDLKTKPDRIGFMTHDQASSCSRTTMRSRLIGFRMRVDLPRPRTCKRFMMMDLPTLASATTSASTSRS